MIKLTVRGVFGILRFIVLIALSLAFVGCDRKSKTHEQIRIRASRGDTNAQFELALALLVDLKKRPDAVAAIQTLASAGHPRAEAQLGIMHFNGIGVTESRQLAWMWFLKAAKHGDPFATFRLAQRCETEPGITNGNILAYALYTFAVNGGFDPASMDLKRLDAKMSSVEISQGKSLVNNRDEVWSFIDPLLLK